MSSSAGRRARRALYDLSRHPATARHIATKLARHFVADQPPKDLVEALAKNFLSTNGDLTELCRTLIDHDAAWRAPATKIRTPQEFVVAAMRATGFAPKEPGPVLGVVNALGMPLWQPGGPNGFADTASVWASPEQMKLRLDASWQMAQRARDVEPMAVLEAAFGAAASRETREAVSRAVIPPAGARAALHVAGVPEEMSMNAGSREISRRAALQGVCVSFAAAMAPWPASAAGARDPRFVVIILRGAIDGLAAVAPVGDPDYASLRGRLALASAGERAGLPLDGFFVLHPAMPNLARLYGEKRALLVHAAATGYRERSHFDGQDVLESGYPGPGRTDSGWLNRAVALLPSAGGPRRGLSVGVTAPLVMRGPAPVLGLGAAGPAQRLDDLAARVLDLYRHRDPALASALQAGLDTERMATKDGMSDERRKNKGGMDQPNGMRQAAAGAARLLAAEDGRASPPSPSRASTRIKTRAASRASWRRALRLGAFEELEKGLGPRWKDTTVVVITEFGRTARINGTNGSDHGTGTVAFLAGGAVAGGRVLADWPGLKASQLYQGRDLAPTTDLRAVLKGLMSEQLGISEPALSEKVFPDSRAVLAMQGLAAGSAGSASGPSCREASSAPGFVKSYRT